MSEDEIEEMNKEIEENYMVSEDAESAIADEDKPNEKPAAKPKPSSNGLDA
jgi:hypothetical protein